MEDVRFGMLWDARSDAADAARIIVAVVMRLRLMLSELVGTMVGDVDDAGGWSPSCGVTEGSFHENRSCTSVIDGAAFVPRFDNDLGDDLFGPLSGTERFSIVPLPVAKCCGVAPNRVTIGELKALTPSIPEAAQTQAIATKVLLMCRPIAYIV